MKNKRFTWHSLLLSGISGMIIGAVIMIAFVPNSIRSFLGGSTAYAKMSEIEYLIEKHYYKEVDVNAVADSLAYGYMWGLDDDYASYFTKEQYDEIAYNNGGGESGIGITVCCDVDSGYLYVIHVSSEGPADKAGIKAGDLIKKVGDTEVNRENYADRVAEIKGENGTEVNLTVISDQKETDITVTRGDFVLQSVYYRMIGECCYIEITTFNDATRTQFENAVDFAKEHNAKAMLFDLRSNGGGLVDVATDMLDILLPKGDLLFVHYRDREVVKAVSDAQETDLPMVVLTDGKTASASEYFASALRDYDKAILIGNQTYGKGIMQTTYQLSDGSAVRLTVATVTTKSKTPYHGVGLKPDIEITLTQEQQQNLYKLGDKDPYIQAALKNMK